MSRQTPFAMEAPEETRRLVEPLLAADSVYRLVGNEIDHIKAAVNWHGSIIVGHTPRSAHRPRSTLCAVPEKSPSQPMIDPAI